jgi:hypothetical protein
MRGFRAHWNELIATIKALPSRKQDVEVAELASCKRYTTITSIAPWTVSNRALPVPFRFRNARMMRHAACSPISMQIKPRLFLFVVIPVQCMAPLQGS